MNYGTFTLIEKDAPIAAFFNHVMTSLTHMRTMCAPDSFVKDKNIDKFQDKKFCDFCRYEIWMHAVVERLEEWGDTLNEYFDEYEGSWKFYAASHRLAHVRENGGEKGDYDREGNIRTEGLDDKAYMHYTVLTDLYDTGFFDTVQDTTQDHIKELCSDLIANSHMDVYKSLKKHFGGKIEMFKEDNNGALRQVSESEHELDMVAAQVTAEDDSTLLLSIVSGIHYILYTLKSCQPFDDNKERLSLIRKAVTAIYNMDFKKVDMYVKKIGAIKA